MSFDANKYAASRPPFVLAIGGKSWTARAVGAPAMSRFYDGFTLVGELERDGFAVANSAATRGDIARRAERARARLLFRVLRAAFPLRLSYLFRGDPVRALLGLPVAARDSAIGEFLRFANGSPAPVPPGCAITRDRDIAPWP